MLLIAALWIAPLVMAQTTQTTAYNTPTTTYNTIRTPEIQLGSSTGPAKTEAPGGPSEPQVADATPASTELLATRHFDFIVSPGTEFPSPSGNIGDTSISLGEYARQLRSKKRSALDSSFPTAIARPTDSK